MECTRDYTLSVMSAIFLSPGAVGQTNQFMQVTPFPVEITLQKRLSRQTRTVVPHLNCRPAPVSKGLDPEGARCQSGRTLHHVGPCSIAVDS